MLYNALERPHTRPAKWMDKGSSRRPRMQERNNRGEVMSFSVDFLPGFSDERGSMTPVYVADRCARPQQGWTQPMQRPISPLDTERKHAPLISRDGMNCRMGVSLLLLLSIVMLAILAFSYGEICSINRDVNTARERIEMLRNMSYDIEAQIAQSASEVNVTISAVEMGMISARGVNVIYLRAPEAAVMSNPGTGTLSAEYLGAVFGE